MRVIRQFGLAKGMRIQEAIRRFSDMGGSASDFASACRIAEKIVRDKECRKIFAFSGAAVALGLKGLILEMIERKWCDIIITTGANIVHDIIDARGGKHFLGTHREDDIALHRKGIGRIGNVLVENKGFIIFEKETQRIFREIYSEKRELSIAELNAEIGKRMPKNSFLSLAQRKGVPVYSPGFQDSMLGLQLLLFNQDGRNLKIDAGKDMKELINNLCDAKRSGAIILGGGIPKHYALGANILRGGLEYAVNITTGVPYDASLSGAPLEEGKSWGKAKEKADVATVYGDYSILFPLLMNYLNERVR